MLAVRRWGAGRPAVLLLHGGGSSAATWWRVGPLLAAATGGTVIAPDLPGHGRTPATTRPAALRHYVDGARLLDANTWPVDLLVGHSLGAVVALKLLNDCPESARRLALEEPASLRDLDPRLVAALTRQHALAARQDPLAFAAGELTQNRDWLPEDARVRAEGLAGCDVDALHEVICGLDHDLVSLARSVGVPTLLLWADPTRGSSAVPAQQRELLVDAFRDNCAEQFPTGHGIHRGCAEAYVDRLADWIASKNVRSRKPH